MKMYRRYGSLRFFQAGPLFVFVGSHGVQVAVFGRCVFNSCRVPREDN